MPKRSVLQLLAPLLLLTVPTAGCAARSADPAPAPQATPQPFLGPLTETVVFPVRKYGGWRHEQGDEDMGTERDESTEVRLTSSLVPSPSSVSLTGIFRCREDDKDWTTFTGPFNFTVYTAPPGYEVARIKNPGEMTDYRYWKHIGGKHHGRVALPVESHWRVVDVRFDSAESNDAGIVGFEGLVVFEVVIVPRNAVPVRTDVTKFGDYALMGLADRDVYTQPGRSTDLEIRSELLLNAARTEVQIKVFFRCRENSEDHTTFEGESTHLVYQAPQGSKVLRVHQPEQFTSYEHRETIQGRAHGLFPVPTGGSHWATLQCRIDQWFGGDQNAIGFAGVVDFQVVLQ